MRLRPLHIAATVAFVLATPQMGFARAAPAPQPGPEPAWERFKELGEASIRHMLVDPDSAKFEWPNGYSPEGFQPFLERRKYGYATCGYVNAKNRMGGYAGTSPFVVVIDRDKVVYSEIGTLGGMLHDACLKGAREGKFRPIATTAASDGWVIEVLGMTVKAHRHGVQVVGLVPAGRAARSGIKPGDVFSSLNGVLLSGLSHQLLEQLFNAAAGEIVLSGIDGESIRIAR